MGLHVLVGLGGLLAEGGGGRGGRGPGAHPGRLPSGFWTRGSRPGHILCDPSMGTLCGFVQVSRMHVPLKKKF